MFDDERATAYIADVYGERESKAFSRCVHQRRDDQGLVRQALIPTLPDIHDRLIECVAGLGRAWNLRRGHAVILHVALVRGAAPRWMSSM